MSSPQLDVIVGDSSLGSLVVGYLLAKRGRTVGIVEPSVDAETTTVSLTAARRVEPIRELVERAHVVARRCVVVLQPEGGLSVGMASDRFEDAAHAIAVVDHATLTGALLDSIRGLGGRVLPLTSAPMIEESGAVIGLREPSGSICSASCTLLSRIDVDRHFGLVEERRIPPDAALETQWRYSLDANTIAARFALSESTAAEWWLYGDPFDGAAGYGRVRAFGDTVTLGLMLPLGQVLDHRIAVAALEARLRSHPSIAPLLAGSVPAGVAGRTLPMTSPDIAGIVGDSWVQAPSALAGDVSPGSTEVAMAEVIAEVVDDALSSPRITAARLATLPGRLRRMMVSAPTTPFGPIDGWADELVAAPGRLVEGARLLAKRFGEAE